MPPVAESGTPGADRNAIRRVLEERARALARPLGVEETVETVEMIVMELGDERYGIDARCVREIFRRQDLTPVPVPGTPAFWSGIVNVRGNLHAVLDLRRYLSLTDREAVETRSVLLVAGAGLTVGILVDGTPGVRRLPAAGIGPPLPGSPEVAHRVVRGVTDDLLTVLDVDALLSDPRLAAREMPA